MVGFFVPVLRSSCDAVERVQYFRERIRVAQNEVSVLADRIKLINQRGLLGADVALKSILVE